MAVAFDAKATAAVAATGTSGSITNSNLTIGATGSLLLAGASFSATTTAPTISSMTWNSIAMTSIGTIASSTVARIYIYGLVNPTKGNFSCVANFTGGSGATTAHWLDCFSFGGTETSSVANCCPAGNVVINAAASSSGGLIPSTPMIIATVSGDMIAMVNANIAATATTLTATTGTLINQGGSGTVVHYSSLRNTAAGTTTSGQFTGTASTIYVTVGTRIAQDAPMAQIWL